MKKPLNTFATINFEQTDCPIEEMSARFERLRSDFYEPWLRRVPGGNHNGHSQPPIYIWCAESKGIFGVHWLVHIPAGRLRDFEARLPHWVEMVAGELHADNVIDVRPAKTAHQAARYMAKGITPDAAARYGITHIPQGVVFGRRTGVSRSLGPSARRALERSGLVKPLNRPDFRRLSRP